MKASNLSTAAFLLGALGVSIAACSAQSTGTPPRTDGSSGSGMVIGSSGNTGTGTGTSGSGTTVGSSGSGTTVGSSGSTSVGGTGPIGTAGTGTTIGTAGSSTTGTGGAGAMSCGTLQPNASDPTCCVATGTATDLAIDDLEDLDNTILPIGNRQGYWYSYKDTSTATTLMPSASPFTVTMGGHPCSLMPVPPACAGVPMGAKASAGIKGTVNLATMTVPAYAGMGFDFNNHFMKSCPYGASAYKGITFWARGTVPFKASVKIPATTGATAGSVGSCTAMCEDHYSYTVKPPPDGTSWGQITIMFNDPLFAQAGWGTKATFDAGNILAVQFQIDGTTTQTAPVAYDFAVDDLAFL